MLSVVNDEVVRVPVVGLPLLRIFNYSGTLRIRRLERYAAPHDMYELYIVVNAIRAKIGICI